MNNHFIKIVTIIAGSGLLITGCDSDNSSFETPNANISSNPGIASQRNLYIGADDPAPAVVDLVGSVIHEVSVEITVKIGDRNNQLLTDAHTIFFATEWGLIQPSCTTIDGRCSVTWETSKTGDTPFELGSIPSDFHTTITAWTIGEESFDDVNNNGFFDDSDSVFEDLEEPFIDVNGDSVFDLTDDDKIIDVIGINNLFGKNEVHDTGDSVLNSPNCTHSSLCSTVRNTTFIWTDIELDLLVPLPP